MTETVSTLPLFAGYGIELEYMIVNSDNLSVMPVTDEVIKSVVGEYTNEYATGAIGWSNELVLHVIELKTNGPVAILADLPGRFLNDIHQINNILTNLNGRLMPTAMHPWMEPIPETKLWPHESNEVYETFDRIFNCQGHGWSNLQSMHLNLPFFGDQEFSSLHNAIRLLMPVMPAIAASSPIMEGEVTGLMDTRLETYRRNAEKIPSITGLVIPDYINDIQSYHERILKPMYREIAPFDPDGTLQFEWLNARGAIARFDRNAIEIRVLDTQETPSADIAIAAAIIAILKNMITSSWSEQLTRSEINTESLAQIFNDTIKDAEQTVIDNRDYLAVFDFPENRCEVRELWYYLLEQSGFGDSNDDKEFKNTMDTVLKHGPLARRIIKATGKNLKRSRLQEVYRMLCECLTKGHLFEGID